MKKYLGTVLCFALVYLLAPTVASAETLYACKLNVLGTIRMIGAATNCSQYETKIFWNSVGATGPAGPQGPTGARGPQGVQGPAGVQGVPGLQGLQGAQGPKGDTGPMGATGAAGAMGPAGSKGDTGPQGSSGPQGVAGLQGPAGSVIANLTDLNGVGCLVNGYDGTIATAVNATSGEISLVCVIGSSGSGGGTQVDTTDTIPGNCRFDNGTNNDADLPQSYVSGSELYTGICNRGNPGYSVSTIEP